MKRELLKNNSGQVTIFIVIGIVIVIALMIYFFARDNLSQTLNPDVQPVYQFVDDCVKKTTADALYEISTTGGYFFAQELSTDNHIAYYFYNEKNLMPSQEKIEEEINVYINTMLFFCTRNFEDFPDYTIEQGDVQTHTVIEDEKVRFTIDYPLSIQKGESSYSFESFHYEVPVRLGIIYTVVEKIMEEQMLEKDAICMNCISEWGDEYDLFIHLRDYDETTIIFYVIDRNSIVNEEEFVFNFANRYEDE
ncbi:MAG: hypothetical protein RL557_456 [archaeon]|jgi:hypothetical protein